MAHSGIVQMFVNIKSLSLAVAAFAAAGVMSGSAVQAAPITYDVNQTIGVGSVIGTLETDGTIGALNAGNFLAWDLTLNGDGASYHITDADSVAYVVGNDAT